MSLPLLTVILGPTASGKTSLSLFLAESLGAEIVSCDSVAVYRELEIGTAKPSLEERARVPHHLIDVAAPAQPLTAGDYSRQAREALYAIHARRRLPIVVGGSGLYLRALLQGLFAGPPRSEELRARLRRRAQERGSDYLHRMLLRLDRSAASNIHPNDLSKIVRAIEVCISTRVPLTEMWQQGRDALQGFRILRVGLNPDRAALYQRINLRARQMFDRGLLEETQALLRRYGNAPRPLDSLGYKQAVQCLSGELGLDAAITQAQQGHRNYAKRQLTWFRREPDVRWIAGFGDDPQVQQQCLNFVTAEL